MEARRQVWVSWSAGAPLILNILAILFTSTRTLVTIQTRDTNTENELGKKSNLHSTIILEAVLHKEATGNEL